MSALEVRRIPRANGWDPSRWEVVDVGLRIAGPFSTKDLAQRALDREKRRRACRERACLGCGQPFMSEGPHHRQCGGCRQRTEGPDGETFRVLTP